MFPAASPASAPANIGAMVESAPTEIGGCRRKSRTRSRRPSARRSRSPGRNRRVGRSPSVRGWRWRRVSGRRWCPAPIWPAAIRRRIEESGKERSPGWPDTRVIRDNSVTSASSAGPFRPDLRQPFRPSNAPRSRAAGPLYRSVSKRATSGDAWCSRADFALAIAFIAALIGSQGPEFGQQYRQRIGGALDELKRIVAEFDAAAATERLTPPQAIDRLEQNDDPLAREARPRDGEDDRAGRPAAGTTRRDAIRRAAATPLCYGEGFRCREIAARTLDNYEPARRCRSRRSWRRSSPHFRAGRRPTFWRCRSGGCGRGPEPLRSASRAAADAASMRVSKHQWRTMM